MKSMHFKLFWRYAVLVFSLIVLFVLLLYYIWGKELRSNAAGELQADCDNISTVLDGQMEQMDQLSKRILNSEQLQELFLEDNYSDRREAYIHRKNFSQALFEIIRLSFDHMELNMFDVSGRYIFVGDTSRFEKKAPETISSVPWVQKTLDSYGKKVILATRLPELNGTEEPVISLCRAFSPENPTKETAVLELQMEYSYLHKRILNAIHNQKEKKKILVYNGDGQRIYPYENVPEQTDAYIKEFFRKGGSNQPQGALDASGEKAVFVSKTSDFTGWTVFVAEKEKELFAVFYRFRFGIAGGFVLVLGLVLLLTNRIAAGLSTPIRKLERTICSLELERLEEWRVPEYRSSFREIDSLYRSFEQMKTNLESSLQNAVAARTMAADAQILALQSQMNPHFLYNTLASISVLAEEGEDEKVVKICDDLTLLLRYISSGVSRSVPLSLELEHTRSYISLIKIKYEERIRFDLEVEQELLDVQVPKLIVQPLVENCVKYGLEVEPPWVISIRGWQEGENWVITVRDNGSGFTEDYLEEFQRAAKRISGEKGQLPRLEVNGMGLLNLYTRLWLLYGEDMIFEIGNYEAGGAKIKVGGVVHSHERK